MGPSHVRVVAPSRLHFGMFSFGHAHRRQFGGVGVMIDRPGIEVIFRRNEKLLIEGELADRVATFAERWRRQRYQDSLSCHIEVIRAAAQHAGLGTGTQLGLAIAAGLNAFHDQTNQNQFEILAAQTGRAERSAIGTYGFLQGGLLFEAGKLPGESISPLIARLELPEQWRFVLIRLPGQNSLWGNAEREAFERLPPVPERLTDQLCRHVLLEMLPAAQLGEFDRFGDSIYQFGRSAGMCFAELQGGPFASRQIEQLVCELRDHGVRGVGQSSWGPTVFALTENESTARQIVDWVKQHDRFSDADCLIAQVNNRGAQIIVESESTRANRGTNPMKQSAGTILYRHNGEQLEVLLVHPSGNYNRGKPWSIPKGLPDPGETLEEAARRETIEEAGVTAGPLTPLGSVQYTKSRKLIHGFAGQALYGEPRCASWEVDRAEYLPIERAIEVIHPEQRPLLERLQDYLAQRNQQAT